MIEHIKTVPVAVKSGFNIFSFFRKPLKIRIDKIEFNSGKASSAIGLVIIPLHKDGYMFDIELTNVSDKKVFLKELTLVVNKKVYKCRNSVIKVKIESGETILDSYFFEMDEKVLIGNEFKLIFVPGKGRKVKSESRLEYYLKNT